MMLVHKGLQTLWPEFISNNCINAVAAFADTGNIADTAVNASAPPSATAPNNFDFI